MNKISIAVIGHGFVGKAVAEGFRTPHVELLLVDPLLNTSIDDISHCDVAFVCVPTPMLNDGDVNTNIVDEVLSQIRNRNLNCITVLKSTAPPDYVTKASLTHPRLVYNPEFLTEANAIDDFINSKMLLLGGEKTDCESIKKIYDDHSKCVSCPTVYVDIQTASLIKYTINCFLSTKIIFFNQLNNLFNKIETKDTWNDVIAALQNDPRIGNTHMSVPGHDGRPGFGGACFPKDTAAFIRFAQRMNDPFSLLEEAVHVNQTIRSRYTATAREQEQNISFDV